MYGSTGFTMQPSLELATSASPLVLDFWHGSPHSFIRNKATRTPHKLLVTVPLCPVLFPLPLTTSFNTGGRDGILKAH